MDLDGPSDGLAGPTRTCVGCRSRAARSVLLRVVVSDNELVLDRRATLPGRGAWLHHDLECLDEALRRRAFPRALRVPAPLDASKLRADLMNEPQPKPGVERHEH